MRKSGTGIFSSGGVGRKNAPKGVNVADREYFRQLQEHPDSGLVISKTESGPLNKQWIVIFARRLSGPDGAFNNEEDW